jgi:hypothetical protein
MRNTVIPGPGRFDHNGGEFAFRSGTTIAYINIDVAPIVSEPTTDGQAGLLPSQGRSGIAR